MVPWGTRIAHRAGMRAFKLFGLTSLAALASLASTTSGCGSSGNNNPTDRQEGQSEFESAPPAGQSFGGGQGGSSSGGSAEAGDKAGAPSANTSGSVGQREVHETDIYRLVGDKLYYLNQYRGLMVFDVQNVDQPKLIGRAPIYGSPVEMIVLQGVATVVVGDWYGTDETGAPFHGSVIRSYDTTNPANLVQTGEARIKGWVRDARTVGNVIYTVSEDYGWSYGWYTAGDGAGGTVAVSPGGGSTGSKIVVSSVFFSQAKTKLMGERVYEGYSGAFNVTDKSIILAHDIPQNPSQPWGPPSGKSQVEYIDITDPNGTIAPRGHFDVTGSFQGWGTDNGRWNVDFDGRYARVLTCGQGSSAYWYCGNGGSVVLSTLDFQNLDAPVRTSELSIPNPGWNVAARFDKNRLYLSPSEGYYYGGGSSSPKTPVQIYDTTDVMAPKLAGSTDITGAVWNFTPMGDRIFALGSDYVPGTGGSPYDYGQSKVSLRYLDVADPKNPQLLGTSSFGEGWAWTPAAGTFKAFGLNKDLGMVVLPFSGWSNKSYEYTNGVQIIEFTPTSISTRGAAKTKGWVERGVYLKGRVLSLSDMALSVIDYTDRQNPKVVNEITLARNVVDARPQGATMSQVSTDWWGYDQKSSELRVLPIANAEENTIDPSTLNVSLEGTNARVFRNGDLAYIVTDVYTQASPTSSGSVEPTVQVVDLAGGNARLRGKIKLPANTYGYYGYGWGGCYWYDWWDYSNVVQVQGNALAFRNMHYNYNPSTGKTESTQTLYVVDAANADAPQVASVTVTQQPDWWWGNVRAVGDQLYTTHYEWKSYPIYNPVTGKVETKGYVKYYLDHIDLSNRAAPVVGKRINVPGILVGASETDPSLLYFIDYRWDRDIQADDFAVARLSGDKVYLQSSTRIDGWVGNVFVRGSKAYFSAQEYNYNVGTGTSSSKVKLHELDITDPKHPVDRPSAAKGGWGWLLGVEGDRAVVTSGWGQNGVDVYKVGNGAPTFSQFTRTRGWYANSLSRQGDTLYLASGYWGVQAIGLK